MMTLRKRGRTFHADYFAGGARLRGSLGTRQREVARQLIARLELALAGGKDSAIWAELREALPVSTFTRFTEKAGFKEQQKSTWETLRSTFEASLAQRVVIGSLRQSTLARYKTTLRDFQTFLEDRKIVLLEQITKSLVEDFKVWRVEHIREKKFSRGGAGLALDVAILHATFAYAIEADLAERNPIRMQGRPGGSPQRGAQPFTGDDLLKLRQHAGCDLLAFLLLRWTGLRGGDAVDLRWREIDFDGRKIERVTLKRRKLVTIPIHLELFHALEWERDRRNPQPTDLVLLNPSKKALDAPLSRPRLYERMLALGRRAGVPNAHPHRFRDTRGVDLILHGATPYDVAKALGDTLATVERHYLPFVPELQERLRKIQEGPGGLEDTRQTARKDQSPTETVTPLSHRSQRLQ
jgi:integrase